jgi:ABC transporter substrate binding protein (PQQ-dependent alcohol dehydrogenase system)
LFAISRRPRAPRYSARPVAGGLLRVVASPPLRALAALAILAILATSAGPGAAEEPARIVLAYLSQVVERPPKISNLDLPPEDEGFAGGRLSIADNNTTGRFLGQEFVLEEVSVPPDGDAVAAFAELVENGVQFVILDVPADRLLEMADSVADQDVLLFNAGARDDRLRNADCRDNVMHFAPSRAMLADALAQYLAWKRWGEWFLIVGQRDGDQAFAEAIRRAAQRFGAEIVADRAWDYAPDARRTAQAEVPAFTQGVDHDILIVADEIGEFGEYLAYRTWLPRPIAGSQGLTPTTWHRTHEQWGAAQLQSRFRKAYGRWMTPLDYQVWAPVRAVGEAATRTKSNDFAAIRDYLQGPDFELAGFKGQKLTFRPWNWQLRQPILLAAPRALVSVSPQEGFLHERSLLDTLGYDAPESGCEIQS